MKLSTRDLEELGRTRSSRFFHGRAEHILVEAFIVEVPVPPDLIEEMVQQRTMGLDQWFTSAQPVEGQTAPQQTTPSTSQQHKKR